ncbi:putative membrane protein YdjX (TVP38/TMEM64 family) [Paenibacillus shirakamiensis]|uniref:TVP38/TMEM64 family membrane protein n=1 Tax=Paenibacillus shirakamiensis TaxID=1265935 RepID=A0ABS4JCD5_9BACL|nr:TVP38/TMEM64 family protein [Paenibacillus shirakamiensis]MBP1999389.1 putative membrane protein YdjX (TVP38/TMEM64 family) [Paenibacillus shirakamiensis]
MRKWLVVIAYVILFALAFVYREQLQEWLAHRPPAVVMLGLSFAIALLPVLPYKLLVGMAGLMYGPLWGGMLCLIGSTAAGTFMYAVVRYGSGEQARRWLSNYRILDQYTRLVEKYPFPSVVLWRVIPLIPQTVVNVYAGLAAVPLWIFITASIVGKLPGIFVYAYLGGTLFSSPILAIKVMSVYLLFTVAILWGYKRMTREK